MNDLDALLDGIGEAKPKTKRTSYPVFPDPDGTAAVLASTAINLSEAEEQRKANNKMLTELVRPFFFQYYTGKADIESSIRVEAGENKAVLVTMKNQVSKMGAVSDIAPIQNVLAGREKELFYSTFEFNVDGEEIPQTELAPLITEMKAMFTRRNAAKALSVKRDFKPRPAFYTQRHTLFSPEQNMEIDSVCPIICSVKVRGVV
jgi:hypothetical protein